MIIFERAGKAVYADGKHYCDAASEEAAEEIIHALEWWQEASGDITPDRCETVNKLFHKQVEHFHKL